MIDFTKPVWTKSGLEIRILCTDHNNSYQPVVGIIKNLDGLDSLDTWCLNGRFMSSKEGSLDLTNDKP